MCFQLNCVEEAQNKHGLPGAHGHVYTILTYLLTYLLYLFIYLIEWDINTRGQGILF